MNIMPQATIQNNGLACAAPRSKRSATMRAYMADHPEVLRNLQQINERRISRLTPEAIETVWRLRESGRTMAHIGLVIRMGPKPLRRECKAHGIPTNDLRDGLTKGRALYASNGATQRMTLFPEDIEMILAMRAEGRSWETISRIGGITLDVVRRELKAAGLYDGGKAARRPITLASNEIETILALRSKGRNELYISEEIGISREVIRREMRALGLPWRRTTSKRRVQRGKGFWRSFDAVDAGGAWL